MDRLFPYKRRVSRALKIGGKSDSNTDVLVSKYQSVLDDFLVSLYAKYFLKIESSESTQIDYNKVFETLNSKYNLDLNVSGILDEPDFLAINQYIIEIVDFKEHGESNLNSLRIELTWQDFDVIASDHPTLKSRKNEFFKKYKGKEQDFFDALRRKYPKQKDEKQSLYRNKLESLFKENRPGKLDQIDQLLIDNEGNEESFINSLVEKFHIEKTQKEQQREKESQLQAEQEQAAIAKKKLEEEKRLKTEQEAQEKLAAEKQSQADQEAKEKALKEQEEAAIAKKNLEEENRLKAEKEAKEKLAAEKQFQAEKEAKEKALKEQEEAAIAKKKLEEENRLKAEQEAQEKLAAEKQMQADQEAKEKPLKEQEEAAIAKKKLEEENKFKAEKQSHSDQEVKENTQNKNQPSQVQTPPINTLKTELWNGIKVPLITAKNPKQANSKANHIESDLPLYKGKKIFKWNGKIYVLQPEKKKKVKTKKPKNKKRTKKLLLIAAGLLLVVGLSGGAIYFFKDYVVDKLSFFSSDLGSNLLTDVKGSVMESVHDIEEKSTELITHQVEDINSSIEEYTAPEVVEDSVPQVKEEIQVNEPTMEPLKEDLVEEVKPVISPKKKPQKSDEVSKAVTKPVNNKLKYHLVAGSFTLKENADELVKQLKKEGYKARFLGKIGDYYKVSFYSFKDRSKAEAKRGKMIDDGTFTWIQEYEL